MNIKDPKVLHILESTIGSFIWMIIALAWTDFFNSILQPIQKKFTFLWILWYLFYAVIVTILGIFLVIGFINITNKNNKDENENKN